MTKNYTCIESFCGAGGLGYGIHKAGFEIKTAFDFNEPSIETYQHNVSTNCFVSDVRDIKGNDLLNRTGLERNKLDLFAGGPPCQGFSKQKRGAHLGDDRNQLVLEYARLVTELTPRFFMLENVAMFGQRRGAEFINEIRRLLNEYILYPHFYNSADYGLAQTRQRFVIVGKHHSIRTPFAPPEPTTIQWKTVGEVLRGLPEPLEDYREHPQYPNHIKARVSEINIKRFSYVPQGGGWRDIPENLRLKCHQNVDATKGGWPDVYGRLEWNGQAPTITGGFDSFTRGRYGHPLQNRPLTPREAARLQGFDDAFVFYGNRDQVRHQIGNAVPPPLAEAIGKQIKQCLLIEDGLILEEIEETL